MQHQGRKLSVGVSLFVFLLILNPLSAGAFWPQDEFSTDNQEEAKKENAVEVVVVADHGKDLQEVIRALAENLVASLDEPDPEYGDLAGGMVVCSFVDLKKLTRTTSFGRYMSEQLMGEMQRRDFRVVEIRKSSAITIQEKRGEYGLSRDPKETGSAIAADAMLTGTYTEAGNDILINARIVDNRNAVLLASATVVLSGNRMTSAMLSDRGSLVKGKPGVVYLKKLEL